MVFSSSRFSRYHPLFKRDAVSTRIRRYSAQVDIRKGYRTANKPGMRGEEGEEERRVEKKQRSEERLLNLLADTLVLVHVVEQARVEERLEVEDVEFGGLRSREESATKEKRNGRRGGRTFRDKSSMGTVTEEGFCPFLTVRYRTRSLMILPRRNARTSSLSVATRRYLLPGEESVSTTVETRKMREDAPEALLKLLLDARLLRRHEAPNHDLNREVDIVAPDVLAKVHLGRRLSHADHRLEVTDRDGVGTRRDRLATELGVEL